MTTKSEVGRSTRQVKLRLAPLVARRLRALARLRKLSVSAFVTELVATFKGEEQ